MKQTIKSLFKEFIKISVIVLVLIIPVFAAWQEPTIVPPDGNAPAPVNVSNNPQTLGDLKVLKMGTDGWGVLKLTGSLDVSGFLRGFSNSYFDGRVGIGNITPQAKLDVKGIDNTNTTFGLGVRNSDDNYSLVVTDEGKVGIGTADPIEELGVNGDIRASGIVEGYGAAIECTTVSYSRADYNYFKERQYSVPNPPCKTMSGPPGTPSYEVAECSSGWIRANCMGTSGYDCCVRYQ